MRGLSLYIFAFAVFLISAKASVAAGFVAPVPALVGQNSGVAVVETRSVAPLAVDEAAALPPAEAVVETAPEAASEAATEIPAQQAVPAIQNSAASKTPFTAPAPVTNLSINNDEKPAAPPEVVAAPAEPEIVSEPVAASEESALSIYAAAELTPPASASASENTGLSLQQILLDAYQHNPRILAERARQKATDEQVAEAVSGFRPSARLNYEKGRQRASAFGGADNYGDTLDRSLRIEQPIFRGGSTVASYQGAKQRAKVGQFRLMAVEQQVMFETIAAFMDTVQAQSILAIARNNEDVLRQQLKAAQDRFDVGEVTRTDVAQSEARLSNASAQVISSEGELISAIAGLENLIGKKPEAALASPESLPEVPASLREAMAYAQGQNPELLQTVHAEKAAKYDVRRNLGTLLPQVSLVGTMGHQEGIGAFGQFEFDQDSIGLNVSIPLYQSGAEYARIRQAKATRSQRTFEAMNSRLNLDAVVTQSWEALETSIAIIRARADQIKAAEVALSGVKQEQEYGARTVLDVLDAEQELFIARSNLVRADRDRVVAVFGLLQALGKLTPEYLGLGIESYNPQENLDRVKWLPIGF